MIDYGCSSEVNPDDSRQELWKQQREERGFDDTELWNLDLTIVKFLLPRLEAFSKQGYPATFNSVEEWTEVQQKIINGLKLYLERSFAITAEDQLVIDESLQLLAKNFYSLWN